MDGVGVVDGYYLVSNRSYRSNSSSLCVGTYLDTEYITTLVRYYSSRYVAAWSSLIFTDRVLW